MGGVDYPQQLQTHLETGEYSQGTIEFIHRACRVGRVSEQFVLDILQQVETDFAERTADKVFGAIPTAEAFADDQTFTS